jgi:hypothetical protein
MSSLTDPENPDLLTNYLSNLFEQLKTMPTLFTGMVDQLAMAISTKVRIDSKNLSKINIERELPWEDIKPFVGVHADARTCITQIMSEAEDDLKTAILLIHFYNSYDATPLKAIEESDLDQLDDYGSDDYDDNY